ncbi:MAG: DUF4124 domain-containing protein [Massilia sp.]
MPTYTSRLLFLVSMACAGAAYAGSDINKCVTPSGEVTLTDAPCADGAQTEKLVAAGSEESNAQIVPVRSRGIEHYTLPRMPARSVAVNPGAPLARGLARDVATLKAARANLVQYDSAAQALRNQRLASLQ